MGSEVMVLSTEMRAVMKMVMLIMLSVVVVEIMTSLHVHWCVCLCWRDGPPAAPNCSADLLFLSPVFVSADRLGAGGEGVRGHRSVRIVH